MIESFIDNAKEKFQLDDDIYGNIHDCYHGGGKIMLSNMATVAIPQECFPFTFPR